MPEFFDHKIRHQVFIKAPPEKVYDTITSGDGWNAFFTRETEVDPRPDGAIVFRWRNWGPGNYNSNADGKVLKADRPNLFEFQWYPVGKKTPTTVKFSISSRLGGSVIELTESGYPNTSQGRDMILECASGWGEALTLLKFYLEFGAVYTPPPRDA